MQDVKVYIVRGPEGCGRQQYIKDRFDGATVISISKFLNHTASVPMGKVHGAFQKAVSLFAQALAGKHDPKRGLMGNVDIVVDAPFLKRHNYRAFVDLTAAWLLRWEIIEVIPRSKAEFQACVDTYGRSEADIKKDLNIFDADHKARRVSVSKIFNLEKSNG